MDPNMLCPSRSRFRLYCHFQHTHNYPCTPSALFINCIHLHTCPVYPITFSSEYCLTLRLPHQFKSLTASLINVDYKMCRPCTVDLQEWGIFWSVEPSGGTRDLRSCLFLMDLLSIFLSNNCLISRKMCNMQQGFYSGSVSRNFIPHSMQIGDVPSDY